MLRNLKGPKIERLRKNVVKIFKDCGLSITSKKILKIVDYLDVTFDLQNNIYKSYGKPDNLPVYIHRHSNHPPTILNELLKLYLKEYQIFLQAKTYSTVLYLFIRKPYKKVILLGN